MFIISGFFSENQNGFSCFPPDPLSLRGMLLIYTKYRDIQSCLIYRKYADINTVDNNKLRYDIAGAWRAAGWIAGSAGRKCQMATA